MGSLNSLFAKSKQTQPEEQPDPAPVKEPESKPAASKPVSATKLGGLKISTVGGSSAKKPVKPAAKDAATTQGSQAKAEQPSAQASDEATQSEAVGFPDETPATQPARDVPADADESVKRFIALLDDMQGLTPEPDLASEVIRGIMVELKNNPQYIKHVQPSDVRVMIRTMRENMGLAKIQKAEKKAKRAKSSKADSSMMDDLASLGVDLGGLQ